MPVTNISPDFPWGTAGGVTPAWIPGQIPLTVTVDDGISNYRYVNVDISDGVSTKTYRCNKLSEDSFNVGTFEFRIGTILGSFWGNGFPLPLDIVGSDYNSSDWAKLITFTFYLGGYSRPINEFNKFYFGAAQHTGYNRYKASNNVNDNLKVVSEDNNTFWFPNPLSLLSFQQNMFIPFQVVGNQNNGIVNATGDGIGVSVPLDQNTQIYYINPFEAEYNAADYILGKNILEARFGASLENLFYSINMFIYESCPGDILVRYIDRNGMLRFSAFNEKYSLDEDSEEIGRYQNTMIGSPAMADSDQFAIGYDTNKSIALVRQRVSAEELPYIGDMRASRLVQIWDEQKGDWVRLFPQAGTFRTRPNGNDFTTISLNFDFPTVTNINLV